jgi:uncharacterized protein YjbI with pentapeptide repeats
MANQEQLKIIKQGIGIWNEWRENDHSNLEIDLTKADLRKASLVGANLVGANLAGAFLIGAYLAEAKLDGANLTEAFLMQASLVRASLVGASLAKANLVEANLVGANLAGANLTGAYLVGASISGANLIEANLTRACLDEADLTKTNLTGTNLTGAYLQRSIFIDTIVEQAIFKDCHIYGLSVWNLAGTPQEQSSLIITRGTEPVITVDDLQVAQFIYLLLNNKNVRNVIDTITSKVVLILGRFTDERKAVLDVISSELRKRNYLPILFDFTGPQNRDITETVSTLAHLAKFVIADLTDAKSIPQELTAIVPHLPSVPVQPLIKASQREYGMFEHFKRYPWVLEICHYEDVTSLISSIDERVLQPVENWLHTEMK